MSENRSTIHIDGLNPLDLYSTQDCEVLAKILEGRRIVEVNTGAGWDWVDIVIESEIVVRIEKLALPRNAGRQEGKSER